MLITQFIIRVSIFKLLEKLSQNRRQYITTLNLYSLNTFTNGKI